MRAKTLRADTWNFVAQRLSTSSLSGKRPHKNAWTTEGPCSRAASGAESDRGYASDFLTVQQRDELAGHCVLFFALATIALISMAGAVEPRRLACSVVASRRMPKAS